MKKTISILLTLSMLLAAMLPMGAVSAAEESVQIPLTYHDSTPCKAGSDVGYAFDGNFATKFETATCYQAGAGFYVVQFDGEYELKSMKLYQDIGHKSGNFSYAYNIVQISDDGQTFTQVEGVTIESKGWITTDETDNVQLVPVEYTFPADTKARYVKITNDYTGAYDFRISELFVYGIKQIIPARLSSLEADMGTLSPAFSPETTDYTLTIDSADLAAPVISATAAEGFAVQSIEQPAESNKYVATIIAAGSEDAQLTTYKVKVVSTVTPTELALSYHDSTPCKVSDGGGNYDKLYPLDGVFSTSFKSAAVVGGYYTVAFDGEYELSTMKIYQDYGASDYSRLNKVYVSDNGTDFTEVALTSIGAGGWLNNAETNNTYVVCVDYTFPAGTTAKYLKVTNDLTSAVEFRLNEMFIYGKKYVRPARLSGLEANMGELSPAFDADTTSYTLKINSADLAAPVISATAAEGSEVTSIEQPAESNKYTASVTVGGEGLKDTVYKVKVVSPLSANALTLKCHSSVAAKAGSDVSYAFDGDFATKFTSGTLANQLSDGFYTVELDDRYELTSIKLYQDNGHVDRDFTYAHNVVEISDDGQTFTKVDGVTITSSGWIKTDETDNVQLVRVDYTFPVNTRAKYIKITNDSELAYYDFRISELFVYGTLPSAKLSALSADRGTLLPAFDPQTSAYTLTAGNMAQGVPSLSAEAFAGCNATVVNASAENDYTYTITVTGEGVAEKTYTVKLNVLPEIYAEASLLTQTVKASVDVTLYDGDVTLIVAKYDKTSKKLLDLSVVKKSEAVNNILTAKAMKLDINNETMQGMLWGGLADMKPLQPVKTAPDKY